MKNRLLGEITKIATNAIAEAMAKTPTWAPPLKAEVDRTFVFSTNRRRDEDNLLGNQGYKRIQDLLVRMHVLAADDMGRMRARRPTYIIDKVGPPCIIFTIRPID